MYEPKKFEHLIGSEGFSEKMLRNHFSLYEGYVVNTNKLVELLGVKNMDAGVVDYSELKCKFGWEFNGMRLHELYFENLMKGGSELEADSELNKKIMQDFGSFENWAIQFKAIGSMRGIGWVVLYYDQTGDRLFNVWINEHNVGHLIGSVPIVVMDVFEHAYMTDYETKRADYIEAFMKNVCWHVANARFSYVK